MFEVHEAMEIIAEAADPEANIIFGAIFEEGMQEKIKITVIATGFDQSADDIVVEHENSRATLISPPQTVVSPGTTRPSSQTRPAVTIVDSPAMVRRRPSAAPAAQVEIASIRSFPPSTESEWDVPAYTRRAGR
ncbi:MAG: hypothetical protein FWD57_06970, partial [Polyangiaceae bacterium]|nr:hypothetical protein [Polyangiaceae bacterium]